MANIRVQWGLPTTRESGKPLSAGAISRVKLEISADEGANWGLFGEYGPSTLETTVTDLEPGVWSFRGTVFDTAGRVSKPLVASVTIEDTTPPSALPSLTLTLG